MTTNRTKAKKVKDELNVLIQEHWTQEYSKRPIRDKDLIGPHTVMKIEGKLCYEDYPYFILYPLLLMKI